MTATATDEILDQLYAALDKQHDFNTLGQIADRLIELGRDDEAECLMWCRDNGRIPGTGNGWNRIKRSRIDAATSVIGHRLVDAILDVVWDWDFWVNKTSAAYRRLCAAWSSLRSRGLDPLNDAG